MAKPIEWEYYSTEFNMAQMNFAGRQGWEAFALSKNGTHVYYKRPRKDQK